MNARGDETCIRIAREAVFVVPNSSWNACCWSYQQPNRCTFFPMARNGYPSQAWSPLSQPLRPPRNASSLPLISHPLVHDARVVAEAHCFSSASTSSLPGITRSHHPHQLLTSPPISLRRLWPVAFSSFHSGTQPPIRIIDTFTVLILFPIPSTSCLAYPGPTAGEGVRGPPGPAATTSSSPPDVEPALPCRLLWLLDQECDPLYRLCVCVPGDGCPAARSSASRASSASQSVSCSMNFPLRQFLPLAHSTPRSASPIPVPRPPRTSPYWVRHFQILCEEEWRCQWIVKSEIFLSNLI